MCSETEGANSPVLYAQDSKLLLGPYGKVLLLQMHTDPALEGQDLGLNHSWLSR